MTLLRRISFSFVLIILASLLGYVFRRMLAVNLSVSEYGLFYAIIGFFSFFMLFIDLGLEQAATKAIVEFRLKKEYENIRKLAWSILLFQGLCSLCFFLIIIFLRETIAGYYFHIPAAAPFLILLSIWFFTTPLIMFTSYMLLGFEKTTWYTAIDCFRMIFAICMTLVLLTAGKGVYAPCIAYALLNIILSIVYIPYISSFFPDIFRKKIEISWPLFKKNFMYGLVIALTNFGWIIITQTDILMLTYMTNTSMVGLYAVALPISLLLLFFMRPVIIIFAPRAAELSAEENKEKIANEVAIVYKYVFMTIMPLALCFITVPDAIITILFSAAYSPAARALQILSIGTLFYAFALFNAVIFTGLGKAKGMAKIVAAIACVNIILNRILIPMYAASGAALSTAFSYILLFSISSFVLRRDIKYLFPWNPWIKTVIISAITVLISIILKQYLQYLGWSIFAKTLLLLSIMCGIYVLLIFMLKIISLQEIRTNIIPHIRSFFLS